MKTETRPTKKTVAIIGSGIIGKQLAIHFASYEYQVLLVSRNAASSERARSAIEDRLKKKEDWADQTKRITYSWQIRDIRAAGLIIEAVDEDIGIKNGVLRQVDEHADDRAIIGSNTSSISIKALSDNITRPERFLGIHFFNPVSKMRLVELVRSDKTSDEVIDASCRLMEGIGKDAIVINDTPAFIVNRVLMPLINEAAILADQGMEPKVIDHAVRSGLNHPMGPLELADLIGIDTCVSIMQNISEQTGDPRYDPSPILNELVKNNKLGRKTGAGFYQYPRP